MLERLPNVKVLRSEKNFGFYHTMSKEDKVEFTKVHNRMSDKLLEMASVRHFYKIGTKARRGIEF